MEQIINIHVEKLQEGVYLATSEDMPGLAAQGRTATETLEIARDVARKLMEAREKRQISDPSSLTRPSPSVYLYLDPPSRVPTPLKVTKAIKDKILNHLLFFRFNQILET